MNACRIRSALSRLPEAGLLVGLLAGGAGLTGCTVMATATNPPQGTPSYTLHGRSAPALRAEADKLCPHGYVVTREWQHVEGADRSGNPAKALFARLVDLGMPGGFDEAQLDVQCKAPPPATDSAVSSTPQT